MSVVPYDPTTGGHVAIYDKPAINGVIATVKHAVKTAGPQLLQVTYYDHEAQALQTVTGQVAADYRSVTGLAWRTLDTLHRPNGQAQAWPVAGAGYHSIQGQEGTQLAYALATTIGQAASLNSQSLSMLEDAQAMQQTTHFTLRGVNTLGESIQDTLVGVQNLGLTAQSTLEGVANLGQTAQATLDGAATLTQHLKEFNTLAKLLSMDYNKSESPPPKTSPPPKGH